MIDLLLKTLEHAPALAAMAFIVAAFLRFQERREVSSASTQKDLNTAYQLRSEDCIRMVREMSNESHEARLRSNAVIEKNIAATTDNSSALRELDRSVKDFETEFRRRREP